MRQRLSQAVAGERDRERLGECRAIAPQRRQIVRRSWGEANKSEDKSLKLDDGEEVSQKLREDWGLVVE